VHSTPSRISRCGRTTRASPISRAAPRAGPIRRIEYRQGGRQATGVAHRQLIELEERRQLSAGRAGAQTRESPDDSLSKHALVVLAEYVENHDHSRFICEFGIANPRDDQLLWNGNRDRWAKLQPYLIGLLAARGVPMLWEGQEICQSYFVPNDGGGRPYIFRPVDWAKFYDPAGRSLVGLVRKLIAIRNAGPQFRSDNYTFYDTPYYNNMGLLVFSRSFGAKFSLIALNFTDFEIPTTITLPAPGSYTEQIDGKQNLLGVAAGSPVQVTIPSNYGQIWTI